MVEQSFLSKVWYGNAEASFLEATTYRILSAGLILGGAVIAYKAGWLDNILPSGLSKQSANVGLISGK